MIMFVVGLGIGIFLGAEFWNKEFRMSTKAMIKSLVNKKKVQHFDD